MVVKDPDTQALQLYVYDWEQVGKHEKMGMNIVPMKELPADESKNMTLDLVKTMDPNDKMRGQIELELTYKPSKEDDMPKGFENSDERKTKQIKKNRDPRWGEEFTFMLEEAPVKDRIHAEVLSTSARIGLLHPKETLGYVDISLADVVSNRRINDKFHLIDSKNGRIQIELQWRTS
ncbi:hypothetical protein OROGR_009807 [Orobanche gracilis]